MKINLNDSVKVKLTDWGKEIFYNQYNRVNKLVGREVCKPRYPEEDENGYTEFQLWGFMKLYGEHMGATLPNVVERFEIVYESEKGGKNQPVRELELDGTESNIEILSELRALFNCFDELEEPCYRALSDAIKALTAQTERKTGKWIFDGDCYKCNKCGAVYGWWADSQTSNYCPNCGADMRGGERGEE